MKIYQSHFGTALALLYLCAAAFVVYEELPCRGGGWIDLCGLGVGIITLPSAVTVGFLLSNLGVPPVNFHQLTLLAGAQIMLHIVVCGVLVYLLGCGIEWLSRRLRALYS